MKITLKKLCLFLGIFLIMLVSGSLIVKAALRKGDYFPLEPGINTVVLGHSQTECGLDDSLVPSIKNLSQGGEAYLYTYLKLKKLVDANPQIKNVVVSYANNQIHQRMDKWIWDEKYLYNNYPKYHFMMGADDVLLLAKRNAGEVLRAEAKALKDFMSFIGKNAENYPAEADWGGYLYLERSKVDSLLKTNYLAKERRNIGLEKSETNLDYLAKTVAFCKEKNIQILFLRMPVRPDLPFLKNEHQYQEIKDNRFPEVELLDFKDFPIRSDEFGDFDHLNHKGAKRFSAYFNGLIEKGLLSSAQKQKDIDTSIKTVNDLIQ